MPYSFRLDDELEKQFKGDKINISEYLKALIYKDLKERNLYEKQVRKAMAKDKRKEIIDELKIIGAIGNINQRIKTISRLDKATEFMLIDRNIDMLENELNMGFSESTDDKIRMKIQELKEMKRKRR